MTAGKLSFTQTEFRVREDGTYIGAKVSVERTVFGWDSRYLQADKIVPFLLS
ncbi:hypothetical protein L2E71_22050 [Planktothrix agardhii 1032]|uniref:hypothetical protein n=1 Tax=Planktothrix agardhii TaxID=1160 RepID=UPI001F44F561|nr:hypothetical protein [Planktothrix agardhii]MCF3600751.1 hypothetical protein [Planktothrix agardhii 1032]